MSEKTPHTDAKNDAKEDAENDAKTDLSRHDLSWFEDGGEPVPEDFVDQEFLDLEASGAWAQPAVLLLVAAFAAFLASQYVTELRYFFTAAEPLQLNDGSDDEVQIGPAWTDDGGLALPHNRFAHVVGISERRTAAGERRFFKLVGSQLYVEQTIIDDRPRILRGQPMPVERGQESIRTVFEGQGRLVAFDRLPRRYREMVRYYGDAYRIHFCGYEPSEEVAAFQYRLREETRSEMRAELERPPTDEELDDRLGADAGCTTAWLMIEGESPRGFWYFPLLYLAFVGIIGASVGFLWRRRAAVD